MKKVIDVSGAKIKLIKKIAEKGDSFVYLDPPYYPVPKTKGGKISLNNLYNGHFSPTDFLKLKARCDELTKSGIPFILHNSNCEFIRILFENYPVVEIDETHALEKSIKGRKNYKVKCVIITNFESKDDFMGKITEMNNMVADNEK